MFSWIFVKTSRRWEQLKRACLYLKEKKVEIMKIFWIKCWNLREKSVKTNFDMKNGFCSERKRPEQYSKLYKICTCALAISSNNANGERIFSYINVQRTEEKKGMEMKIIEAILQMLYNYNLSCTQFLQLISKDQ